MSHETIETPVKQTWKESSRLSLVGWLSFALMFAAAYQQADTAAIGTFAVIAAVYAAAAGVLRAFGK